MYNARMLEPEKMPGRILAIDWGEKRIGVAVSDETQTIARPFEVIVSGSRKENAKKIEKIAYTNKITEIIIGVTYDQMGELSPSGRRAARLAEALRKSTFSKVKLYDESGSTKRAKTHKIITGVNRKKRKGHLDAEAAAIFLQDYLDRKQGDR